MGIGIASLLTRTKGSIRAPMEEIGTGAWLVATMRNTVHRRRWLWLGPVLVLLALADLFTSLAPPVLALAYLSVAVAAGLVVTRRLFPSLPSLVQLSAAALGGLMAASWVTFLSALVLSAAFGSTLLVGALLALVAGGVVVWRHRACLVPLWPRLSRVEAATGAAALLFATWLYHEALRYDDEQGQLIVSDGTWADFALHLAFARSFSWGNNLPPQYPLFGGVPVRYHFGYDFLAGTLERLGLRLDFAFNIPAVLAYAAMVVLVFELARLLAGRIAAGVLAALLVPFSSSLAFIDYLRRWGPNPVEVVRDLWANTTRLHIGPYNDEIISSHFTFIPYLNQRQLTFAIAAGLVIIYALVRAVCRGERLEDRQALALGIFLGLSFPWNGLTYLGVMVVAGPLLLLFRRWREGALLLGAGVLLALPPALLLSSGERPTWHPGYLIVPLTVTNFLRYWWLNFGLLLPLVAVAAVTGSWRERGVLAACFGPFVLGSLFQLGPDLSGINHKVFNQWAVLMAVFGGVALARIDALRVPRAAWAGPALAMALLPPLLLSGIIDAALIKNERAQAIPGAYREAVDWLRRATPAEALFLTAPDFYAPPTLAGRRIYLGPPSFPASAGYEVESRRAVAVRIYAGGALDQICMLLVVERIDYVQVGPVEYHPDIATPAAPGFWEQFPAVYTGDTAHGPLRYYRVNELCGLK